jgi:hypothetical protein
MAPSRRPSYLDTQALEDEIARLLDAERALEILRLRATTLADFLEAERGLRQVRATLDQLREWRRLPPDERI